MYKLTFTHNNKGYVFDHPVCIVESKRMKARKMEKISVQTTEKKSIYTQQLTCTLCFPCY